MSLIDWIVRQRQMLQYMKDNHPCDPVKDREDGVEYLWHLGKKHNPFHSEGVAKTQHNEEND